MILTEAHIRAFGRFHDRTFRFSDGINVIHGKNESGKSTLHFFLRAMLFGMERARGRAAKTDTYARFTPWTGDGAYGGTLRFLYPDSSQASPSSEAMSATAEIESLSVASAAESGPHLYRIERNFAKDPMDLTIVDETRGAALPDPQNFLREVLGGLSLTAFDNTVSIGQLKSATDKGMVDELKNYIGNMNASGSVSLNISKADAYLKDQRRAFEQKIVPDAARAYAADQTEIRKLEEKLSSPEYLNRIPELNETRQSAGNTAETLQKERELLLKKGAEDRQKLKSRGFENREEIRALEASAEEALSHCRQASEQAKAGGPRILGILFALLAAGLLGFATWFSNSFAAFGAAAAALLAMLCFRTRNARRQKAQAETASFYDLIRPRFPEFVPGAGEEQAGLEGAMQQVREETASLLILCDRTEQTDRLLAEMDGKLSKVKEVQAETETALSAQQKSQWELEQLLEHLANVKDEAAALKTVMAENERLRTEIEAIDIARETMLRLSTTIRESFGLYLNRNASAFLNGITGGIYRSLSIDQDLNISLNTPEKLVPLEQVSSGTIDQVYLGVRLAAADLFQGGAGTGPEDTDAQESSAPGNCAALPLFLDDSFVNYDEERLRTVLKWLPDAFPGRQVLIFSCHKREAQLMSANLMTYRLVEITE